MPPVDQERNDEELRDEELRSLDLVQRAVVSVLVLVVLGLPTTALVYYSTTVASSRADALGLWVMTGILGIGTAAAVLIINRRRPYSPLVLLGLLPMAVAGVLLFT